MSLICFDFHFNAEKWKEKCKIGLALLHFYSAIVAIRQTTNEPNVEKKNFAVNWAFRFAQIVVAFSFSPCYRCVPIPWWIFVSLHLSLWPNCTVNVFHLFLFLCRSFARSFSDSCFFLLSYGFHLNRHFSSVSIIYWAIENNGLLVERGWSSFAGLVQIAQKKKKKFTQSTISMWLLFNRNRAKIRHFVKGHYALVVFVCFEDAARECVHGLCWWTFLMADS